MQTRRCWSARLFGVQDSADPAGRADQSKRDPGTRRDIALAFLELQGRCQHRRNLRKGAQKGQDGICLWRLFSLVSVHFGTCLGGGGLRGEEWDTPPAARNETKKKGTRAAIKS